MKKNLISIGNAGQYFVAAELERHGFTAAVPMSGTKDFDILAISSNCAEKQFAIQVKTTTKPKHEWTLSKKNEEMIGDNIFYVFVYMIDGKNPEYHIVPSITVANYIKKRHTDWLNKTGKKGQKHNDNNIRKFRDFENEYLNKWESLNK